MKEMSVVRMDVSMLESERLGIIGTRNLDGSCFSRRTNIAELYILS